MRLVPQHGFTRETLSLAALAVPDSKHVEPLSERAVTALFGEGDDARKVLIDQWLLEGRRHMQEIAAPTVRNVLARRLEFNKPALPFLKEASRPHLA